MDHFLKMRAIEQCQQPAFLTLQFYFPHSTDFKTTSRMHDSPQGLADVDF